MERNNNPMKEGRKLRSMRTVSHVTKKILKCHICRQKKDSRKLLVCTNFQLCHHTFCFDCVDRNFHTVAKKEHLRLNETNWPCFTCRGQCKCNRCKQNLAEELKLLKNIVSDKGIIIIKHLDAFNRLSLRNDIYKCREGKRIKVSDKYGI